MKIKSNKSWLLAALVLAISVLGVLKADFTSNTTNVNTLELSGPYVSGDSQITASVTLPTITTAQNFSHWVPVLNVGAAVTLGDVLMSSYTTTGSMNVTISTGLNLTNVLGVAAESIASGAKGWMIPRGAGYAVVHATGVINAGQLIASTGTASGYVGGFTNGALSSLDFGTAISSNTNPAGGSIIAILH